MAGDLDIVGSAAVDVVPIAPNFHNKLKAIVLPAADRVGEDAGRRLGDAISRHITISIPDAINQGGRAARVAASRQGDNAGGAFASSLRRKLEAAFKAMPKLDVKLSDTGVDAQIARLRAKLEQLSNKRIGIDVGAEEARAEVARLEEELKRLGANHPNPRIRIDTAAATASLAEIRAEIDAATATPGRIHLEVDGHFGAKMRAALAEAQASLPHININADTSDARAELQRLREQMATLGDQRVGIDIDAATARAKIDDIRRRLEVLTTGRHDIDVRVDSARAAAQLAALDAQADSTKHVNIDTSQASGALMRLSIQLAATAAIPLGPILVAGLGAVASAATAAGAGVGALALAAIPAIKGVTAAIQAKSAAEKEAASSTGNAAAADKRAAQSALQMESAQQALTSAHRNAARSIAQANRQVEDAERALGQAAARAMDERRQAAENVERAERSLVDAKRQARDAEEALTKARRDATQQLADLNDKLAQGKLDERDATLRVQEAQAELNKTRADFSAGKATQLQLERAQLAYDQAVQSAKQQKEDFGQLQKDAAAAKKAGVEGNSEVKRASEELAKAQQHVQDETRAVADAQRKAAQAQVQAAQEVADAQRGLSDAVANAANAQVQAAESIQSAERGVQSARLSAMDTTDKASKKTDAYRQALAKLTPEQRRLFDSIAGPKGLTAAFKDWSKSLQPDVLPLFVRGVDGAKATLPTLTPLVKTAADAIGELMDRASADLKRPFWQGFKKDIADNAKPAIVGLGVAFGNILKGMAGIVDAFLPHMDGISGHLQRITQRFADWGTNLKGSPEFENFLAYVKDNAPRVAELLGDIMKAGLDVAKALEPASQLSMAILSPLMDGISWVANNMPEAILLIWGLYAVNQAIKLAAPLWAAAVWVYNFAVAGAATGTWSWAAAIQATGIVPLIEAIVIAVAALVIGIIWAYKNVGWFRDAVDASWKFIKDATLFLWEKALKPAFDGIVWAIKGIGAVAVWLWENAIKPAWDAIVLAGKILVAVFVTLIVAPIVIAVRLLGSFFGWLWNNSIKPIFNLIAILALWLWRNVLSPFFHAIVDLVVWLGGRFVWLYNNAVKPIFNLIAILAIWLWKNAIQPTFKGIWWLLTWLGDKFAWLYDHTVRPIFDFIGDKAAWLYDKALKPAFDKIKSAIKLVGVAFDIAKVAIKQAWDKVASIAAKPVNFIVDMVYNKGIKAVWDKVADFVGLDPLPKAPKLLNENPKFFAQGGRTSGGIPGKDSIPILAMADEFIIKRSSARRIGFDNLAYMNATGEIPRFANGGIVGSLGSAWDWTKDKVGGAISKGVDWAKTAGDLITNPSKIWGGLMKPFLDNAAKKLGVAQMGKTLLKYPLKMVGSLKDKIVNAVSGLFAGGGGYGLWQKPIDVAYGTKFGVAGSMWSSGHHTGLDFPAPVGTPIHAVADGTVSSVSTSGPYGNHITIDHGGGLQSLYAHMSKILVDLHQRVAGGQTIGRVGATGNVTGPHLHLEARVNGRSVDPLPYLQGGGPLGSKSTASAKAYAKSVLPQFGWGANQFPALEKLWTGESGWRWDAKNPSSGAYGIPQALPASKMASAGSDWRTNPATQIRWGLGYIHDRPDYGSPAAAYAKWLSRSPHWYDNGGLIPPGLSLVANGTGSPEPVFTAGQWSDIRAAKSSAATPTTLHADVRVFVGDREITDIVDTRIEMREEASATALNTGRWL